MGRTTATQREGLKLHWQSEFAIWVGINRDKSLPDKFIPAQALDLLADYADLERRVKELEEWLPIETAPRDRTYFLACGLPKSFWPPISVKYHKGEDCWTDKDGMLYPLNAFTSWKPLPAPPKAEKEEV